MSPSKELGKTMRRLAAETGLPLSTLYMRWARGDRGQDLIRPKRRRRWHSKAKEMIDED